MLRWNRPAVDGNGNIYVAGRSDATWGTPGDAYAGDWDVFTAKLTSPPAAIPTLNEWGMVIMALLLAVYCVKKIKENLKETVS